ncbi:MAG: ABC transporter ATP-binding protein [Lachnospiraceae bacterium]|nr:ABC transporter ATP-binding protein [Lachnospiraceae bacterium]
MLDLRGTRIEKTVGKYSFFNNLLYHYKNLFRWEPLLFWSSILIPIPALIYSVTGNLLPALVVQGLEEKWTLSKYLVCLIVVLLIMLLFNLIEGIMMVHLQEGRIIYASHYMTDYEQKKMRVDFNVLEDKDFQNHANTAYNAIYQGRGIIESIQSLPYMISLFVPALVYGVILARLHIMILLLSFISCLISAKLLKIARTKHSQAHPTLADYSRKMTYITSKSMEPSAGKDIRIYKMTDWLLRRYDADLQEMNQTYYRIHNWYMVKNTTEAVLTLVSNFAVYAYLTWLVIEGKMTAADFVLYFGFANSFSQNTFQCLRQALSLGIIGNTFGSIREYFDTPERRNQDNRIDEELLAQMRQQAVTLELRDVSFTYPGEKDPILSHINLKITAGEKLALIGLNGAGKTTLVKLICGFYPPSEGEILINDIPIEHFEREQYYSLLSVLFQDYTILPVSVDENIASSKASDIQNDRLTQALTQSGFASRYERLTNGGKSLMVRDIHTDAIDFSGGEKQRLLFARALYKDVPLLILDEPTAALDPIAENEIYMKYGEVTKGKTSIYISHRLSSTRFCDRIVLLEQGHIIEEGTHTQLMAQGGRYAELYEMQSRYYKEQEETKRRNAYMEGD